MSGKRIGIVGVGLMGHGIARNVARHGWPLAVLEHPGNRPLDELRAAGVTTRSTAAALAADSDSLILCVTGSPEVEAVLTGPDGVLRGLRPGAVVIDCSTAVPASTLRMAQAVGAAGGRFADAPMTRTPKHAHEGKLNLLVGADPGLFDEIRPLLACFAENITHVGPVGSGHRMKLVHNFVSLGSIALMAEAAALADTAGIAPEVLVEVLAKGGGGGAALERLKPYLLARDASGLQFFMANALKDLSYYTEMADGADAVHRIADAVASTYDDAVRRGGAQALVPELVSLLGAGRASGR
jgi:3-hydroxyisobutyrate dehydrogenase-like beta-hydroxyacid dehydrogenase